MDTAERASSPLDSEQEVGRRTVMRAMWIGLWVWPAFTVFDAYMCFVAYHGARFSLFVLYRAVIGLVFLRRVASSRRELRDRPPALRRGIGTRWMCGGVEGGFALGLVCHAVKPGASSWTTFPSGSRT